MSLNVHKVVTTTINNKLMVNADIPERVNNSTWNRSLNVYYGINLVTHVIDEYIKPRKRNNVEHNNSALHHTL